MGEAKRRKKLDPNFGLKSKPKPNKQSNRKMSFRNWLKRQKFRDDTLGVFAKAALGDPSFPEDFKNVGGLKDYLKSMDACSEAIDYGIEAFKVYQCYLDGEIDEVCPDFFERHTRIEEDEEGETFTYHIIRMGWVTR